MVFAAFTWSCTPLVADDAVTRWNILARDAVRFANTPPPVASRDLAILHVAVFDAVNAVQVPFVGYRCHTNVPVDASREAAVAGAANRMLRNTWPQFTTRFDAELQAQLLALPNDAARAAGLAWGRQVAQELILERAFDGSNFGVDYGPAPIPGRWQPTPILFASALLPQWGGVLPFTLLRADQFRPLPPPVLGSSEWAEELNEVKGLGAVNSSIRTPEQREIAWFWADGVGTETPPGHWNRVAAQLVKAKGLDLVESARLFALLNLALADAGIACWQSKYEYDWWRPITAIRAADTDGNPATEPDPTWAPLVVTPPFPEHVSGHSTFSAAAAAVLEAFHGSDEFTFDLESDGLFGVARTYHRFSDAAREAGDSRIYGGIHFQSANREGQRLGRAVGQHVMANYLLPRDSVRLAFEVKGDTLELAWPLGARLQVCDALDDTSWDDVEARGRLTVPLNAPARFFRVKSE